MSLRIFADVGTSSRCASLFPNSVTACKEIVEQAKNRALRTLSEIYSVAEGSRTFSNTARAADIAGAELHISASLLAVTLGVSPDKETRDEANKQLVEMKSFAIDHFGSNKRLFEALKELSTSPSYLSEYVNGNKDKEYSYWLNEKLDEYRRQGMELPDDKFQRVVALQKEISAITTGFSRNISEDKTEIFVSAEELKGVPENIVSSLGKNEDGKYRLKMDYPIYFGVMENCEVTSTRQIMAESMQNRAYPVNEGILKQMILKRHELAENLGFKAYSYLNLDDKMAKSPDIAHDFVAELIPRLQEKWMSEFDLIKKHLHESCKLTEEGCLQSYDVLFMINQIKKNQFNISETEIQEYFPLDAVVKGLFEIYQAFFDVTFTRIDNGTELWDNEAFTLEVVDNPTKKALGHVILDLFPREGKYTHACCHSVVPPVLFEDSEKEYSPALAVVITNFPAPSNDRPALFLHDDVKTFFHEFGHAIHSIMGRSRMATFAGTNVKWDFVELPSQMLEEWLWEPEVLQKISSHYKTKKPMSKALIDAKVGSQNAFSGYSSLRQLEFASYSLQIYGLPFSSAKDPNDLDTTTLMESVKSRINPQIAFAKGTHFECSFGHLTSYGAAYYGYMWSKVFALDIFDYIASHNGLFDSKIGRRYVECIIGVGGGRDPTDMVKEFLGRDPNNNAFLKRLGV